MFRMKKMMRKYIVSAVLFSLPLCAFSQNINPTVQVTNDYQGKIMEVHKGELPVSVADSLLKFDWNFDYAVTDNPYRGAYDFSPYLIDTTPEATPLKQSKLYLRAGAGYTFHPEASLVYTPLAKSKVGLSLYDNFSGFSGDYYKFRNAGNAALSKDGSESGHLYRNRFGVNGRVSLGKPELLFDAGLDHLRSDSFISGNNYGAIGLKGRLNMDFSKWNLAVDAGIRRGDNILNTANLDDFDMDETLLDVGLSIVHKYAPGRSFEFHPSMKTDFFNYYDFDGEVSNVRLAAVYKADFSRAHLRGGVLASFVMGSVDEGMTFLETGTAKPRHGNILYPDFYADYVLVPQTLKVYASLTGGPRIDDLGTVLDERPFVQPSMTSVFFSDVVSTPYDAELGVTGRIGARVQYKFDLGYRKVKNELAEVISKASDMIFYPQMLRVDYKLLHFDAQMDFTAERYEAHAALTLQDTDFDPFVKAVALPKFKASGSFTYNWNKRIYAGVSASYMGRRLQQYPQEEVPGADCGYAEKIPAYLDLGLNAEYKYNQRLSFWLRSGNLLCQPVYQQVLFAQKGLWATLGLTLTL
jgi:hypothetical protein